MSSIFLLLGTNLGNKEQNLCNAIDAIKKIGSIKKQSGIYITEPWGFSDKENFFNMALCLETTLSPPELMNEILTIEASLGRTRQAEQLVARKIDIDIIFFNDRIVNRETLTIPHSQAQNRKFVLIPVHEIAPGFIHPVYKKNITELLHECHDSSFVERYMNFHFNV